MSNLDTKLLDYVVRGIDLTSSERSYAPTFRKEMIARTVMVELIKAGRSEFLLLGNDEVAKWWNGIVTSVRNTMEKYEQELEEYKVKMDAFNKLTEEERKLLKIRAPRKPRRAKL